MSADPVFCWTLVTGDEILGGGWALGVEAAAAAVAAHVLTPLQLEGNRAVAAATAAAAAAVALNDSTSGSEASLAAELFALAAVIPRLVAS